MTTTDMADQRRALDEFANADAQRNQPTPGGHALVRPTTGISERIVGAQPVAVRRDEEEIFKKLATIAARAGDDWLYRFPTNNADGSKGTIKGPSIKLANDLARIFGNNVNEVREIDVGDAWIFYARFTDIETGFSMERAYRQRKGQRSMRTKDADRQLDIAYQIGQSKAIRNCIVNSLQLYADFAFDEAEKSLVNKIGRDLPNWRERTLQGIANIPVELRRVERVIGRAAKDWLAPDISQVISMMKSIADGMATVDETFPPDQQVEPPQPPKAPDASETQSETGREDSSRRATPAGAADADQSASQATQASAATEVDDEQAQRLQQAFLDGRHAKRNGKTVKQNPFTGRDETALAKAWLDGWNAG